MNLWLSVRVAAVGLVSSVAFAQQQDVKYAPAPQDNIVLKVSTAALNAVRTSDVPLLARDLAMVHTATYDAWASYSDVALPATPDAPVRRPAAERTPANRITSIAYAAHTVLSARFPDKVAMFDELLHAKDVKTCRNEATSPCAIGQAAGRAVLASRARDGSNADGAEPGGTGKPFSDYTGYKPLNGPKRLDNPEHWQPLPMLVEGKDSQQVFRPNMGNVRGFALTSASEVLPPPPAKQGSEEYKKQAERITHYMATLNDYTKAGIELWADGPNKERPAGFWNMFAGFVSRRDHNTLDGDVKMFFVLNNALMDAGVAAWYAKRHYDYVRPISLVPHVFGNKMVETWGGPGKGTVRVPATKFQTYLPTPNFPEYVSGHSTYGFAGARALQLFTGSDYFGGTWKVAALSSTVEPGLVPATEQTLGWPTFSSAATEGALGRQMAGVHFEQGDMEGRKLGAAMAEKVWAKANELFTGGAEKRLSAR